MINRLFNQSIKLTNNNNNRLYCTITNKPLVYTEKHLVNGVYTGVQILKLNKPNNLNALTFEMGDHFKKCVDELVEDKDLKCVVLTGEGKAFSAGGDLDFLIERTKDSAENNQRIMEKFYRTFLYIRNIPVPVISAINGAAIGAGCCLTMATDMRVVNNKARLGFNFTVIGIHPGMGVTHFLPTIVGSEVASYMLLTGELIKGDDAHKMGLVSKSVDPELVLPTALTMAEQISKNSSISVRATTKTLRNKFNQDLDKSLTREADAQSQCWSNSDIVEGIKAIREKREPIMNNLLKK